MPKDNIRSRTVTHGVERAPNRAMLRAVGFGDGDFDKPIVAVANGYSTITPCNIGLNLLTDRAVASLRQAGTMPQVFGTITVSDGISMGTEGMKYSLRSEEHTSELQSQSNLVCRLLLEKKTKSGRYDKYSPSQPAVVPGRSLPRACSISIVLRFSNSLFFRSIVLFYAYP